MQDGLIQTSDDSDDDASAGLNNKKSKAKKKQKGLITASSDEDNSEDDEDTTPVDAMPKSMLMTTVRSSVDQMKTMETVMEESGEYLRNDSVSFSSLKKLGF